jgi:hypothetical protein
VSLRTSGEGTGSEVDVRNLTPNPFPSGKGNQTKEGEPDKIKKGAALRRRTGKISYSALIVSAIRLPTTNITLITPVASAPLERFDAALR